MIGQADLHKAVNTLWDSAGLDSEFTGFWEIPITDHIVLHDQEADPGQPFPYCVFRFDAGNTVERMSGSKTSIREIRDVPLEFIVYSRLFSGDARTQKKIAADLVEKIMEKFGGHPTIAPSNLILDNGHHLQTTYQNDYGVRTGEDEYAWVLSYVARLDIPVEVTS